MRPRGEAGVAAESQDLALGHVIAFKDYGRAHHVAIASGIVIAVIDFDPISEAAAGIAAGEGDPA
jgi:hypothetical protein